jgi:hypothetical protein
MLAGGALATSSAFSQSVSCPAVDSSTGITTPAPGAKYGLEWLRPGRRRPGVL